MQSSTLCATAKEFLMQIFIRQLLICFQNAESFVFWLFFLIRPSLFHVTYGNLTRCNEYAHRHKNV